MELTEIEMTNLNAGSVSRRKWLGLAATASLGSGFGGFSRCIEGRSFANVGKAAGIRAKTERQYCYMFLCY